jgi:hypothetical protein
MNWKELGMKFSWPDLRYPGNKNTYCHISEGNNNNNNNFIRII